MTISKLGLEKIKRKNQIKTEMLLLVKKINKPSLKNSGIIKWGSPIISFGNVATSKIATVGLNPSNREFVDQNNKELKENERRFHTLKSLGLTSWSEVNEQHVEQMMDLCSDYFLRNPYNDWFKKIDYIISGTSMSYYFPSNAACHLDIVPYATKKKWTDLSMVQKKVLIEESENVLGFLLLKSNIKALVLNGQTVIEYFQELCNQKFEKIHMPTWTLPRRNSGGVKGYAYEAKISEISKIRLSEDVIILGYNHNIQSSYGITKKVQLEIRKWITKKINF